ncbi:metallophosphoesterase [Pseudoalteromonas sp. Hal099]
MGDLQGCFKEFSRLLKRVDFNPSKDHLYLVGDIVARGSDSLACLDYIYRHQDSMSVTLGNHDLHMVACHYLNKPINPKINSVLFLIVKASSLYRLFANSAAMRTLAAAPQLYIALRGLTPSWSIESALKHTYSLLSVVINRQMLGTFLKKCISPTPLYGMTI